tara:strand:- start:216 stop:1301 length:1086 start_codon:yes stop_codon:yes gene_type:complete
MVKKKTSKKDIDEIVESILAKVPEDPKVKRKRLDIERKIDKMSADMRGLSLADWKKNKDKILKEEKKAKERHDKLYWTKPLLDGQLMMIATSQQEPPYKYMGKKLDYSNLHKLTMFMSNNKGFLGWEKERKRLLKLKEGIEKPFKPLQNLVNQYQAIGKRLRATTYLPETEALKDILKSVNETRDVVVKIKGNALNVKTSGLHTEPDGEEFSEGQGLNAYMIRNNIKDKLDIPDRYLGQLKTGKLDYVVKDYDNVVALAEAVGVYPATLFKVLCEHIKVSRKKYQKQRLIEQGKAVTDLVDEYLALSKGKYAYSMNRFFGTQYRKDWSIANGINWKDSKRFIEDFTQWKRIIKSEAKKKLN